MAVQFWCNKVVLGELVGMMLHSAGELVGMMLHSAGELVGIRLYNVAELAVWVEWCSVSVSK